METANKKGFSLVETLVAMAVFAIIALGVYQAFIGAMRLIQTANLMTESSILANEKFEIIHNLPYSDVGTISGIPTGKLLATENITRNRANFQIDTTIRNIDDPFDGVLGGTPGDSSPADYKLVELRLSISGNNRFKPISYTKIIAPKNLENASTNGALFVQVLDASGQPVSGAEVQISNSSTLPPIAINDTTDKNGYLQIVDAPPGIETYEISVFKAGYSQERTYTTGEPSNPNPIKKHATVALQTVTEISFAIDQTGTVNVETLTETCSPVGSIDFLLEGAKLIGTEPDVIKFQNSFIGDLNGQAVINGLEWDNYKLTMTDSSYEMAGSISIIPFNLNPGSTQDVKIIVAPKNPNSLVISVKQGGTQLPLSGVKIDLSKGTSTTSLFTGRGFLRQNDWSKGPGQSDYIDTAKYYNSDGNIEDNLPIGEIKLKDFFGSYAPAGVLTSSIFDTGSASNFYQLDFLPLSQPPQTGTSSIAFKIATNNDHSTWNFLGPDGSTSTFYTIADLNINPIHNGDRYFRYQAYLKTASTTFSPNLTEVSFTFSSLCVPSGQVRFSGLSLSDYALTASKAGYQTLSDTAAILLPWQQKEIILMPE